LFTKIQNFEIFEIQINFKMTKKNQDTIKNYEAFDLCLLYSDPLYYLDKYNEPQLLEQRNVDYGVKYIYFKIIKKYDN
jgi:hypothetical protein